MHASLGGMYAMSTTALTMATVQKYMQAGKQKSERYMSEHAMLWHIRTSGGNGMLIE